MLCNNNFAVKMFHYYFLCVVLFAFVSSNNCEIINTQVLKVTNLETQLAKTRIFLMFKSVGLNCESHYFFVVEPGAKVAFIKFKNDHNENLPFQDMKFHNNEAGGFKVDLQKCLNFNESIQIIVDATYIEQIVPARKTRRFTDEQLLLYTGDMLFYSMYKTLAVKTTYVLPETENADFSYVPTVMDTGNVAFLNRNVAPLTFENVKIEYESKIKLIVVTKLRRFITVSHYGEIFVEDQVDIRNEGSKLVGPFYYNPKNELLDWFYTHLPASANNIKFYDIIGNNSKSEVLNMKEYKTFKFKTRYPLLSGWKSSYVLTYSVPTYEYLFHDENEMFSLRMRAVDHIVNDVVVKDAIVKVLLPHFSEVIDVELPRGYSGFHIEKSYTALIKFGRPTVVFNASNLLENHIENFDVKYKFSSLYMLHTPMLLMAYVQKLFLILILVLHYYY